MYSLRVQLIVSVVIASAGGLLTAVLWRVTPPVALTAGAASFGVSYGILYLFVYRPLQRISAVVRSQQEKEPVTRVNVESSDEFLRLSDALNNLLGSFHDDISRLKKLERVRTEFLANVSHELRTPIFSTQGLLETLLNGAIDDTAVNRDFLTKALKNTERLNSLLGDLIDISRIESGEMKLRFRYFDIVPFLVSIVAEMQTVADRFGVQLRLDGDAGSAAEVYGDKERLRHVMVNLINNAAKYTEKGGTVTVRFLPKKDRVEVSVEDTGIGIAPQHLPRIFERFYRVDRDRSRDVGGTGLGLAIVKHIVEAHDAEIRVKSEIGAGSTFTFWVNTTDA
ncbi:MAG: two-component sensor histidine kinase [Bacteroidetes bacterium]|nr:MAG: two-component sensor histidine kinase [Bacteroidota bacterium]